MAERDFLYMRRLVGLRPFVSDQGLPGLHLKFEPDEEISAVFSVQTMQALSTSLQSLQAALQPDAQNKQDKGPSSS